MKEFFDSVRSHFGSLSQSQVDGFNVLLKATTGLPLKHRAYILATAWHETARTMQPIAEYGKGSGRPYGKPVGPYGKAYYGRGYVQLTWQDNYEKAGKAIGIDLVQFPEKAMDPEIAALIIVRGMKEGWFTGKKLSQFDSYVSMRAIVNGTDRASLIAGHAEAFDDALEAASEAPTSPELPPPATSHTAKLIAALTALVAAIGGVVAALQGWGQ